MKNISIMIKPASSLCNLRCEYCFYANVSDLRDVKSFGLMTIDTADKLLTSVRDSLADGDRVTFAFQGGEPTLAGIDFFRHFCASARGTFGKIKVNFTIQTNAVNLDDEWCRLFYEYEFLVGVSLDLPAEYHDAARKDSKGSETSSKVLKAVKLLKKYKVEFNILCTLTEYIARHPQKVFNTIKKLDLRYVQFTPCMGELGACTRTAYELSPKSYGEFYDTLFDLWYEEFRNHNYYSIKLFDDVVNLLAYGACTCCGIDGKCRPQVIVEADGSTYPCDFYCIDAYCIGNITEMPLDEIIGSDVTKSFINREHTAPVICSTCRYYKLCGSGCKRLQDSVTADDLCGYKCFLDKHYFRLYEIAEIERTVRMGGRI